MGLTYVFIISRNLLQPQYANFGIHIKQWQDNNMIQLYTFIMVGYTQDLYIRREFPNRF